MSQQIPLTQGKFAIVDDEDYEWLSRHRWFAVKDKNNYYAVRYSSRKEKRGDIVWMHREILGLTKDDGRLTDHRNHYGLDNRMVNLRICTNAQNAQNRRPRNTTSKYKGVSWNNLAKKWQVHIKCNRKSISLGYFNNEIKAAKVYDKKAEDLFGEFAYLNFGVNNAKKVS